MKFSPLAFAAAAFLALPAIAQADSFAALSSSNSTGFTTETSTIGNQYLMPIPPAGSTISSYSVLSTNPGFSSVGTISFAAPVTSYTFLWGSPDTYNTLTDGLVTVTGSSFSSGTGNNAESTLYTFSDLRGFSSLTFSTTGVAFEVAAVTAVPEPETYALFLAGLAAMGFITRRRKNA